MEWMPCRWSVSGLSGGSMPTGFGWAGYMHRRSWRSPARPGVGDRGLGGTRRGEGAVDASARLAEGRRCPGGSRCDWLVPTAVGRHPHLQVPLCAGRAVADTCSAAGAEADAAFALVRSHALPCVPMRSRACSSSLRCSPSFNNPNFGVALRTIAPRAGRR